jgi:hypothetical protein
MVDTLIDIISREAALLESFLDLLEQQREALVNNDADALSRITALQQQQLIESQELNRRREAVVSEIKADRAVEGDLTVSRLVELVDGQQADSLKTLRDAIHDVARKITETRNSNAMLINQSREFIARMMQTLSRINNPQPAYSGPTRRESTSSVVMVDRRA